jgi:hypothetical protein
MDLEFVWLLGKVREMFELVKCPICGTVTNHRDCIVCEGRAFGDVVDGDFLLPRVLADSDVPEELMSVEEANRVAERIMGNLKISIEKMFPSA